LQRTRYYDIRAQAGEELPEDFHELAEFAILASHRDPFDPMERHLENSGTITWVAQSIFTTTGHLFATYPLSNEAIGVLSLVWKSRDGEDYVVAAKVLRKPYSTYVTSVKPSSINFQSQSPRLRVKASSAGRSEISLQANHLPSEQHDFNFEFLGLVGLADPRTSNRSSRD
jgi:Ca2+-transporting ATPase